MIINPRFRGFICTAAHPDGCALNVKQQIDYACAQPGLNTPLRVLVIGGSTGYGLSSRIVPTFSSGAKTIGVCFEKSPTEKKTASAGWYNTAAFEQYAHAAGHYAKTINGDAFSDPIKAATLGMIEADLGQIDLLVYSLASPRRTDPATGITHQSTLKPIGTHYENKTVDPLSGKVSKVSITPASEEDIQNTVAVMGGDDWAIWIDQLRAANLLAPGFKTLAYSYVGPELTHPIYKAGTIGAAKTHLHQTAERLNQMLGTIGGEAFIAINKALVTQASSAIPVVPLYMSILFKLMKENGTHEGCIEQIYRLFAKMEGATPFDEQGFVRMDDWEMAAAIQDQIPAIWSQIDTDNLEALSDIAAYRKEFHRLFGFGLPGIDYEQSVDILRDIPSIQEAP
jgi:enoyl-[acyl-carrier protein] reductase/trans-2-enoyl-CoA reductase (NAD+)